MGSISNVSFRLAFLGCVIGYLFGHLVRHRYLGLVTSWLAFAIPNADSFGPEQEYSSMMGVVFAAMCLAILIPVVETSKLVFQRIKSSSDGR